MKLTDEIRKELAVLRDDVHAVKERLLVAQKDACALKPGLVVYQDQNAFRIAEVRFWEWDDRPASLLVSPQLKDRSWGMPTRTLYHWSLTK